MVFGWGLTPRLPMLFDTPLGVSAGRLTVVAGVPGTGKSGLADEIGRRLGWPVFSTDWLMGALTPFGGRRRKDLGDVGDELVTTLAYRQLLLGQPAILDTPGENTAMRRRWSSLTEAFDARFDVVICICSDESLHRQRLEQRSRAIPGWHDGGRWDIVKARRDAYPAWKGGRVLVVDAVRSTEENAQAVIEWLAR